LPQPSLNKQKLWHLVVMVAPRRDGRAPPDPDSWTAHFDALQAGGLRNLDLQRALSKIVLPVLLNVSTCLALPYIVTRGLLPLLPLSARALQVANLYGHQAFVGAVAARRGYATVRRVAVRLHNAIRDDRYLVGRELHNFEAAAAAAQAAAAQAAAADAERRQAEQEEVDAAAVAAAGGVPQRHEAAGEQQQAGVVAGA
jgi:hypothetical protein